MKSNINLSLGKKESPKNPVEIKVAYFIFAGIFAVAMIVLIILFVSKIQYSRLLNQESNILTSINQQADKKLKMVIMSERLDAIKSIIGKRGNLNQKMNAVTQMVPDSLVINTVEANEDKLTLSLVTVDLLSLNNFFETVLPSALKQISVPITNVTINNVTSSSNTYRTSITFTFASAGGT